jgi:hypothetical protein
MELDPWDAYDLRKLRGTVRLPADMTLFEGADMGGLSYPEALDALVRSPAYRDHMSDGNGSDDGSRQVVMKLLRRTFNELAFMEFTRDPSKAHLRSKFVEWKRLIAEDQRQGIDALKGPT